MAQHTFTDADTRGQTKDALNANFTELYARGIPVNPLPLSVADNEAKLALTIGTGGGNVQVGRKVIVTGQANRVEELIAADPSTDASWLVLKNTVYLQMNLGPATGDGLTVNGIACAAGAVTEVGWVYSDAIDVQKVNSVDGYTIVSAAGGAELAQGLAAAMTAALLNSVGVCAIPIPVPPRGAVSLGVSGGPV